jgi:hypothetical protein
MPSAMANAEKRVQVDRFQLGHAEAIQMLLDWPERERPVMLIINSDHVLTFVEGTLIEHDEERGFFFHEAAGSGIQHCFSSV